MSYCFDKVYPSQLSDIDLGASFIGTKMIFAYHLFLNDCFVFRILCHKVIPQNLIVGVDVNDFEIPDFNYGIPCNDLVLLSFDTEIHNHLFEVQNDL